MNQLASMDHSTFNEQALHLLSQNVVEPVELPREGVHLWLLFVQDVQDEELLGQYRLLLAPEELKRYASFYFAKDRHRYLVTRALIRTVLSRYALVAPQNWRFGITKYGRPIISNEESTSQLISFNVSHTDGLVILAVTTGRAIGVDVENLGREPPLSLVDCNFSPQEADAFRLLPDYLRRQRFFELWTLKESYIKARGMGLSIPLDRFGFDLARPHQIVMSVKDNTVDCPNRWHFSQMQPSREHLVGLCVENQHFPIEYIAGRRVVPLRFDFSVDCNTSRNSAVLGLPTKSSFRTASKNAMV